MTNYTKAFITLEAQKTFKGVAPDVYAEIIEGASKAFIACNTELGKARLEEYLAKVTSKQIFSTNITNLLKDKAEKVVIVSDTSLLLGYICIDQLSGVIKYYVDHKLIDELKAQNKAPRTADEVIKMFLDKLGFIPVKYKAATMLDLANGVSHKFETIKMVMDEGDNTDVWSNSIKVQIIAGINRLEYTPNANKFYFVLQSKHGWYLKADTEKNELIKQKIAESKAKKEDTVEA